jgi:hypothetical protein
VLITLLLLATAPDGGLESGIGGLGRIGGRPEPEVVSLGSSAAWGAITTVKSNEDYHWSACGYAMYFHELVVKGPDAGWSGFLGHSGSSGCPAEAWNDVDTATLLPDGGLRLTSGFKKGPTHRARVGAVLNLVPYQDFAVPRELGPIKRLPQPRCLEVVQRPGVFFETFGWCTPTVNAVTCLALRNRCDFAIDAEGHTFSYGEDSFEVLRGCVIPAKEHALVVGTSTPQSTPQALTFWTALCPAK